MIFVVYIKDVIVVDLIGYFICIFNSDLVNGKIVGEVIVVDLINDVIVKGL